jgi:hypothetical protein
MRSRIPRVVELEGRCFLNGEDWRIGATWYSAGKAG